MQYQCALCSFPSCFENLLSWTETCTQINRQINVKEQVYILFQFSLDTLIQVWMHLTDRCVLQASDEGLHTHMHSFTSPSPNISLSTNCACRQWYNIIPKVTLVYYGKSRTQKPTRIGSQPWKPSRTQAKSVKPNTNNHFIVDGESHLLVELCSRFVCLFVCLTYMLPTLPKGLWAAYNH